MFDFYFGDYPKTLGEEIGYLVSVKRTLPRWCNSIPDAEFSAICKILYGLGKAAERTRRRLVLVETGAGASSLALAYYALKYKGVAYSWDMNGEKGSVMRTACTETICKVVDRSINRHWKFVAYDTLSPYAGLSILKELTDHVDFIFHDSQHVLDVLLRELSAVDRYLGSGSVVAVDDAYYAFGHTDTAYINITRQKLNLAPIGSLPDNQTKPFYIEVERFLKERWKKVKSLSQNYKLLCHKDVSIAYFGNELTVRRNLGMKRVKELENRFGCWQVGERKRGVIVRTF